MLILGFANKRVKVKKLFLYNEMSYATKGKELVN